MTTRRIRFAPLPDPRRSVILTDDGKEHPLPDFDEWDEKAESWSCIPESLSLAIIGVPPTTPYLQPTLTSKTKKRSSFSSFLRFSHSSSSSSSSPESSPNPGYDSLSSSCSSASSSSSIHTLTPTQSNDTSSPSSTPKHSLFKQSPTTVPLNFGSGLFRTSSRDPPSQRRPRSATHGSLSLSLSRWTSGPGPGPSSAPPVTFGVPLYRTQSTQSYKKSKRLAEQARASGLLSSLHSDKNRGGQKMLNGRVYGAKRGNPVNHFNSIKDTDSSEPDFVEWGYGGMGSVKQTKNGVGGKVWSRLAVQGDDESGDGGGMEWVRKRKEAREREKKEKEAREKEAEAEAKTRGNDDPTSTPPRPTITTTPTTTTITTTPTTTPETTTTPPTTTPTQSLIRQVSSSSSISTTPTLSRQQSLATEADHITRAVNVPAPVYKHHHHHHRKQSSLQLQVPIEALKEQVPAAEEEPVAVELASPTTPPSSSSSSSSEDEDSEGESSEGREGEEDEEDEIQTLRMTCRSAGVEKVSRQHR